MDDIDNQLHIPRKQISVIQQKGEDLIQEDDRRFLEKAKANIGRCFYDSESGTYAKIVAVPQIYTVYHGYHLNRYQYPAIFIGESGESGIPIYEDTLSSGVWGNGVAPSCNYKEINPEEFNAAFTKTMDDFIRDILSIGADSPETQ